MAEGGAPGQQSPAQPSLKTLTNELKFVTDWHSLGVNLDLEYQQLDVIARNHKGDNKRCKTEMLDCWLHSTPTPTWEGVAEALCLMDEYAVAATIRRKYVNSTTTTEVQTQALVPQRKDDNSLVLAKENLKKIREKFAPLIALAGSVLQEKGINISHFRLFLTARYLPAEDSNDTKIIDPSKFVSQVLGKAQNVCDILQSLIIYGLLDYKNIDILCLIVEHYASDNSEVRRELREYKEQLAGHILVIKIIDYLNAKEQQSMSKPVPNLLHELSVKVEAKVTENTLKYVSELRESLAYQVKLPAEALLFHGVAKGCVEITWLLPFHLTDFATRRLQESTDYFREKSILRVTIAGRCVYEDLLSLQEEEIKPQKKGDPDDPDAGNLTSLRDDPDSSSLQRIEHLIGDDPEGPEDIPEHEQAMRCGRVICTNYSLLYGQLDAEKLLPKLPEKDLIDENQLKEAKCFHQRFAKNAHVIRILLWYDRPSHGLLKFCDTLETTPGQEHLGRKLLKDYKDLSPVHVQSPSAVTAVHSDLSETSELFQQLQREVIDFLDPIPNALAELKQVLASLVLPIAVGRVVPLVNPHAYESAPTVRELFRLMAPYWNPLSTDLLILLLEASGYTQAASKVAEFVEARANKRHLVLCIRQLPALASGESDSDVDDLKAVHNAPLSHLQSLHPAVFARLPEHEVTSTRATVRISVKVNKPLLCLADYEEITTALSGFFQVPKAALVYAGCSNAPLVLCWVASHELVAYIESSRGGLLSLSMHQLLAEKKVAGIAVGDHTVKCLTTKEVELQMVTQYGSVEQLRYLLTSGADVNMAGSVSGRST